MIHKIYPNKRLHLGINYSVNIKKTRKQLTLKLMLPWFIWKLRAYDIEADDFKYGWRLFIVLVGTTFNINKGSNPIGKQKEIK